MSDPARIGRYEVRERLGMGGMGAVYLAWDPNLQRLTALKVVRGESGELIARFNREATTAARLSHPNIATIYDVGEHDGQPFIAMEYVEGPTLAQLIARGNDLPLLRKLQILDDICAGAEHAHRAGIVHRDLKPANFVLNPAGVVKILDFGIARPSGGTGLTVSGMIMGTPSYMSPEQLKGELVDPRSDVFSIGATAYEFLSGVKAFAGNFHTVLTKLVTEDAPRLSQALPGVHPELERLVAKALERSVDRRYQDVSALRADLRTVIDLVGSQDHQAPAPPPSREPVTEMRWAHTETVFAPPTHAIGYDPLALPDEGTVIARPTGGRHEAPGTAAIRIRLLVVESPDSRLASRAFDLIGPTTTIGREAADVAARDPGWSRRHAVIELKDGGYFLRDLDTRNGTFVDGQEVRGRAHPLLLGSTIIIGKTMLRVTAAHDTALPDLTGTVVANRYRLERLLRESAQGAVYAARMTSLPRSVAIKVLSPDLLRYPGYRERLRRRAEVTAQLQHPHICRVLDYGSTRLAVAGGDVETEYLCADLLEGGSLADRMEESAAVETDTIRRWIDQLAEALDYAHEKEVVHGDLKPTAVVFDTVRAGNPHLTDFALGRDRTSPLVGTPAYMSPEQWASGDMDAASDQFALAVLAYQLITGTRPFEGQDHPEIRRRNFARGPLPAHEEAARIGRASLHPEVSLVLARALDVSPAKRYASILEFAGALGDALSGKIPQRDPNRPPRVFLSYQRSAAAGWAVHIASQLRDKHAVEVFIDVERVDSASRFPDRLARAIRDADLFVCLVGPTTLDSPWVQKEIEIALQHEKPMIPIFQEHALAALSDRAADPVTTALSSYDGVQLLDLQNIYVDSAIAELARRIKYTVQR